MHRKRLPAPCSGLAELLNAGRPSPPRCRPAASSPAPRGSPKFTHGRRLSPIQAVRTWSPSAASPGIVKPGERVAPGRTSLGRVHGLPHAAAPSPTAIRHRPMMAVRRRRSGCSIDRPRYSLPVVLLTTLLWLGRRPAGRVSAAFAARPQVEVFLDRPAPVGFETPAGRTRQAPPPAAETARLANARASVRERTHPALTRLPAPRRRRTSALAAGPWPRPLAGRTTSGSPPTPPGGRPFWRLTGRGAGGHADTRKARYGSSRAWRPSIPAWPACSSWRRLLKDPCRSWKPVRPGHSAR